MTGYPTMSGSFVNVSALTAEEATELNLTNEKEECQQAGLSFVSFPIEDRSVPASRAEFAAFINHLYDLQRGGKSIALHCRAGIGRSSMFAAALLIKSGFSADSAFHSIEQACGCPVPDTPEQQ